MEFTRLFRPITINGLEISNRIVMPSMGLSYTADYSFNERYMNFYRERARGGVGLMTIGPLAIDRVGSAPFMPGIFDDRNMGLFRTFLTELHNETGAKIATQLFQMGRYAFSALSGIQPIAPSPVPYRLTGETPRAMTQADIEEVKKSFADAAGRAREAGFDFVEILGCTGYLVSQFLSPVTNQREDEYGGCLENRMRFGLEVIQAVRKAVGSDFPIGIRIAGHDFMPGGNTNREAALFAAAAEKAGVDAINVTGGWHETNVPQLTTNVPPGVFLYLARGIKEKVSIPVFASNRLGDPLVAEKALRSGACDMICWARPLIADPELPNKVREGRLNEIVPCIACNQGCFDSIFAGTTVHCVLNPRAGREGELITRKTEQPKKIIVAGGGPAGMEFALTAARRGHRVTLYEKESEPGGQVNLAKVPPGKQEFHNIIDSMTKRMAAFGVNVITGETLTAQKAIDSKADLLVVATGAKSLDIDVPGIHLPHVVSAWDVLRDKVADIGERVVVVGGSATGCETAHYISGMETIDPESFAFLMYHEAEEPEAARKMLHTAKRKITVIEMMNRVAENVGRTWRWSLIKCLRNMGIEQRTRTRLVEITENAVVVENAGKEKESIPADTVIIAVGARPVNELAKEAEAAGIATLVIGDAKKPRKLTDAIREGFEAAMTV